MTQLPVSGKILIVNPDRELGDRIERSLRDHTGFEAVRVSDAESALQLLKNDAASFPLVISDLHLLEGLNGLQFAQELRKELVAKPEIVLLSSDPRLSLFECHQAGIARVLSKPVNIEELCRIVHQASGKTRRFERVQLDPNVTGSMLGHIQGSTKRHDVSAQVSNIGRGGFFYRVEENQSLPEIGQIVDFDLTLALVPDCRFKGKGIVRWTRRTAQLSGVGVEFLTIPEDSERLIVAFVDLFRVRPFVPDEA